MIRIRRSLRRALRRAGLPVSIWMWLLIIGFSILGGAVSAYVASDEYGRAVIQSLARQQIYNMTGLDARLIVKDGTSRSRISFEIPYEKFDHGVMSRKGTFYGRIRLDRDFEIEGETAEIFNSYGDSGRRNISTSSDGVLQIWSEN